LIDYQDFCGIRPHTAADDEWDITAGELKARLDRGEPITLLDVREPHEWDIAHLEGARLIPVAQVQARAAELNTAEDIVVYCKGGTRSARAVQELRELGFRKLKNLKGGINAWSEDVDPSVPLY
jgi:sulfur-carrier protein adenylyltransferase/sulfurtransferase